MTVVYALVTGLLLMHFISGKLFHRYVGLPEYREIEVRPIESTC